MSQSMKWFEKYVSFRWKVWMFSMWKSCKKFLRVVRNLSGGRGLRKQTKLETSYTSISTEFYFTTQSFRFFLYRKIDRNCTKIFLSGFFWSFKNYFEIAFFEISWGSLIKDIIASKGYQRMKKPFECYRMTIAWNISMNILYERAHLK